MDKIRDKASSIFNLIYDTGIIIKGVDGLIELVTGLLLLISPGLVHTVLSAVAGKAATGHNQLYHFIGDYVARLDKELAASGLTFLIIFLITHGVVKLVLVYCLLKKIVKVYPAALAILGLFLVYQLYVFIQTPTVGMALFCLLDAAIIVLVWREYKMLKK
jgi:uncharacterized membrane protein